MLKMETKNGTGSPDCAEPVSPLSPENFHVSLSSLFLGGDPVVPDVLPSPETGHETPSTSEGAVDPSSEETQDGQQSSSSGVSSSNVVSEAEVSEDSEAPRKKPCNKQCNSSNEQSTASEGDTSSKCSSEPQSRKDKKYKAISNSTQTTSGLSSDADVSTKSGEASTSANTNEGDSSGQAETTDNDDSEWTLSDDAKLRGMKEDDRNPTWAEISKVLGKSKKEVQLRWKVLKDQPKQSDADDESSNKDDGKADKERTGSKKQEQKQHGVTKQKQKGGKGQKSKSPPRSPSIRSGDVPSSPSSSDSDPNDMTFAGSPRSRRQKRYMHQRVHTALYGRSIAPEPDEYFSQRDCDILANIESKYKQGKYLEMQANFYNVTGRMIPLSVIRDKCERAEEEQSNGNVRARELDGKRRVEAWVSSVDENGLEDPDS